MRYVLGTRRTIQLSWLLFAASAAVAALVLVGWTLDVATLKSVLPGYISMKANTATGLLALAVAGQLLAPRATGIDGSAPTAGSRRPLGMVLAAFVLALALATLSEYLLGVNLGIDELLFADPAAMKTRWPPGRFAPVTCFNFIFISSALLIHAASSRHLVKTAQALVLVAWVVSFQALVGYVSGVTYSFGSAYYTQIALHTAVAFVMLSSGILVSWRHEGFFKALASDGVAGKTGRRLLLAAVLVPPLINAFQLQTVGMGLFDADFGVLIRVVGSVIFFSWIAFQTGLYLLEAERRTVGLQSVTTALAQGVDLRQVGSILVERGAEALGAQGGAVLRKIEGSPTLELVATYRLPDELVARWRDIPADIALPLPTVLRTGIPVFLESAAELDARFPAMREMGHRFTPKSIAAIPLLSERRIVAAVGFVFEAERRFDAETREYILSIAAQCAIAIERASLFERERARAEELQQALKARDDLLHVCSHELRTPVTSMKLQTQLAKRNFAHRHPEAHSQERMVKLVEQTDRQLDRLTRLIEEMLDFSRIGAGQFGLSPAEFDLQELVVDVLERFKLELEASRTAVALRCDEPIRVVWDRFRVEQVLVNLLTNAMKYGDARPIELSIRPQGDLVEMRLRDQGIGIATHDLARIFRPYERAVPSVNISGLGLGLYISKQIVESHGGVIEVTSELGRGSEFVVRMPARAAVKATA